MKRKHDDNTDNDVHDEKPAKKQKTPRLFGRGTYSLCGIMRFGSHTETSKLMKKYGAKMSDRVTSKVTHLICDSSNALSDLTKVPAARRYGAKLVYEEWIHDCIEKGERIDDRFYLFADEPDREADVPKNHHLICQ
jgi:NAD-dependent DNA ligase